MNKPLDKLLDGGCRRHFSGWTRRAYRAIRDIGIDCEKEMPLVFGMQVGLWIHFQLPDCPEQGLKIGRT